jgi:hypothetical protein
MTESGIRTDTGFCGTDHVNEGAAGVGEVGGVVGSRSKRSARAVDSGIKNGLLLTTILYPNFQELIKIFEGITKDSATGGPFVITRHFNELTLVIIGVLPLFILAIRDGFFYNSGS